MLSHVNNVQIKKSIFFLVTSFLIVIATFRAPGITPDTLTYFSLTKNFLNSYSLTQEPFHYFLLSILKFFEFNYYTSTQVVFFVYVSISVIALNTAYNAFKIESKLPLFLYFFTSFLYLNLIQIRWGLAVALIVLAISQLKISRFRSLIFLLIAPFVHTFAIIALPVFLIFRFKLSLLLYIILPITGIFLGKYFDVKIVINFISNLNYDIIANYKNNIIVKLQYYFDMDRIILKDNPINLMFIFFISSYCLSVLKSKLVNNSIFFIYLNTLCFGIFMYLFFVDVSIFSRRISYLLVPIAAPLLVYSSYFYKYGLIIRVYGLLFSILICINFVFLKGLVRF